MTFFVQRCRLICRFSINMFSTGDYDCGHLGQNYIKLLLKLAGCVITFFAIIIFCKFTWWILLKNPDYNRVIRLSY